MIEASRAEGYTLEEPCGELNEFKIILNVIPRPTDHQVRSRCRLLLMSRVITKRLQPRTPASNHTSPPNQLVYECWRLSVRLSSCSLSQHYTNTCHAPGRPIPAPLLLHRSTPEWSTQLGHWSRARKSTINNLHVQLNRLLHLTVNSLVTSLATVSKAQ